MYRFLNIRSLFALFLLLSLLSPSVTLALEGALGGSADGSEYGGGSSDVGGGTDTSESDGGDYSGDGGQDSPSESGPGPGQGGADDAATDQAAADAQTAASYGMNGDVDVNATAKSRMDGTIDNDQVAMTDGTVQSLSQGKMAKDAVDAANAVGGYVDPAATHAGYQDGTVKDGQVVGNKTGAIGSPTDVAKAEIDAQKNIDAVNAINNSAQIAYDAYSKNLGDAINNATDPVNKTTTGYQPGLAQSFYSGPKGVTTAGATLNDAAKNAAANVGKYSYNPNVTNKDGTTGGWTDQNGRNISIDNVSPDIAEKLGNLTDNMAGLNKDGKAYSATIDTVRGTITTTDLTTGKQAAFDIKSETQVAVDPNGINSVAPAPVGPANQFTKSNLGNYTTVTTKTTTVQSFVGKLNDKLSHSAAASMLSDKVSLKTGPGAASLDNIRSSTVATANNLAQDCNCNITITSGTDGKHAPGTYSHEDGGKIDIRSNDQTTGQPTDFSNYMHDEDNGWSHTSTRSNGDKTYTNPDFPGVNITEEDSHWDAQVKSDVVTNNVTYNGALTSKDSLFSGTPKGYEIGGDKSNNPGSTAGEDQSDKDNNGTDSDDSDADVNANYTNKDKDDDSPNTTNDDRVTTGRRAGTTIGGIVGGPVGAVIGGALGGWLGGKNLTPGGKQTNQEKSGMRLCPPYPVSCQAGAAILGLPAMDAVTDWFSNLWNGGATVAELPTATEDFIKVLISVNTTTGAVDINRPDIVASFSAPNLYYTKAEYAEMEKLLNETPILFAGDGSIVYSNGLYSPPVKNGEQVGQNVPRYLYAVEYLDESGNPITIEDGDNGLPGNNATNLIRSVLGNATPFETADIASATYRVVDPKKEVVGDEYYDYVITLTDGTVKAITVPQFTSIAYMQKRFGELGFRGDAADILSIAEETTEEPDRGLIASLFSFASDQISNFIDVENIGDTPANLPTVTSSVTAAAIEKVFIYPRTDISCPTDIEGYETGFMYTAIIKDNTSPDYVTMVSDGRCGTSDPAGLVAETARHLENTYGISGADYDSIVNNTYFIDDPTYFEPIVARVYRPSNTAETPVIDDEPTPATSTPAQKPNLTNDITLEVKAVDSSTGEVLSDWSNSTKVTITQGVNLYFRWDGSAYGQCLPFLQDGGNYALTRQDRAMLKGNTETEKYNVTERTAEYKIECGGQRNDEFGVDERVVEVVVQ